MTQQVEGRILYYRTGPRTQKSKECIIQFTHILSASEAASLVGRKVVWRQNKNRIVGTIIALHGLKGLVRVRFRRGVPGNALGSTVELGG
jgi:large subunit ribosomal protein L35Ae